MNPDELRSQILAAARAVPSSTRGLRQRHAALGYLAALAASLFVFQYKGGLAHGAGRPVSLTVFLVGGALVLAAAALAAGTWRGHSTLGRPLGVLAAVAVLVPLITFAWIVSFSGRYVEPFERFGWVCMGMTLVCGALVLGVGLFVRRRSVPMHAAWHGAAIAAGAGAVAGILVDVWCPLTNAPHVLVGHVAPMVILGLAGALLGPQMLAIRR